jgi:hypothetical protein
VRRIKATVVVLAGLAVVAGCAIPNESQPVAIGTSPSSSVTSTTLAASPVPGVVTIFLVDRGQLVAQSSKGSPGVSAAVKQLLSGPTEAQTTAGLSSAIPSGTHLEDFRMTGTTADLDFDRTLASVSGQEQLLAFAQIVATATGVAGVTEVQVLISGEAVNAPKADGTLAQGPVGRSDYGGLFHTG